MLKSLYISSFVIIDKIQIDFNEGMSSLTGETGAGKSIIVDAISQLYGDRASASLVKKDCEKAVIEGIFDYNHKAIDPILEELNIDVNDDLSITKEILSNGKSIIKVNYKSVSSAALKTISSMLIHIHSQFDTHKLFSTSNHIHILDDFIGLKDNEVLFQYTNTYKEYKSLLNKLKTIQEEDFSDEMIEFYQSQINEINDIEYTDEDIDEFEEELNLLKNYEKINESMNTFNDLMSNNGVLDKLKESLYTIRDLEDMDLFKDLYTKLNDQYYIVEDLYESIEKNYRSLNFNEYRFEELQEILFKVNKLKRKYGYSMNDIYKQRDELQNKIEHSLHREELIEKLNNDIKNTYTKCSEFALVIHEIRVKKAIEFEKLIRNELNDLYLNKAEFKVSINKSDDLNSLGYDDVTFMVSMNEGQKLSLLNETASGGEISRLMLAIKVIILKGTAIDTIIFDEVDTGVSGKVASAIGSKMRKIALNKQVICITHLPQVAVFAKNHYSIHKSNIDHSTYTNVSLLQNEDVVNEIAKMLSGEYISEEAISNARRLLDV